MDVENGDECGDKAIRVDKEPRKIRKGAFFLNPLLILAICPQEPHHTFLWYVLFPHGDLIVRRFDLTEFISAQLRIRICSFQPVRA